MTRLLIHVEGQTEEDFVNDVLAEYLHKLGYDDVSARLLGNARYRSHRGGTRPWESVRKDIVRHLTDDSEEISSTLVDYYGMDKTWPGSIEAREGERTLSERAATIEEALLKDISCGLTNFDPRRFVPYVVMHEFEGLLFSAPHEFARAIDRLDISHEFQAIRDGFPTPEDIDDSPETAPSKRIQALEKHYQKPLMGVQAVQAIGLETIRRECPLFDRWIERLEQLV